MIVLDTNVVSAVMAGNTGVVGWLRTQPGDEIYTTALTRAEVRFGLARLPEGARKAGLTSAAEDVFATFTDRWLPFDAAAADVYGRVVADRESIGRPIGAVDAQIVSIARARHASVATRNTRDFEACGVALVNPFVM